MTTGRINQVLAEGTGTRRYPIPTVIEKATTQMLLLSLAFAKDSNAMSSHCMLPSFGAHQLRFHSGNHIWLELQLDTKLHRFKQCSTTLRFLISP